MRGIAVEYLKALHLARPDWSLARAVVHLDTRRTPFLVDLLITAGFVDHLTAADVAAVVRELERNDADPVGGWASVADRTGLTVHVVERIVTERGRGFGFDPYGASPYGGNRQRSRADVPVPRRVSANGQFSYAGKVYGIGRGFQGRRILVRECADHLAVESLDGRHLRVAKW